MCSFSIENFCKGKGHGACQTLLAIAGGIDEGYAFLSFPTIFFQIGAEDANDSFHI